MKRNSIKDQVSGIKTCMFFIAALFITSCSNEVEIPADVLPEAKMIQVLTDVQEIEAAIQSSALERNDSTRNVAYGYYKNAFEKNKITAEQFRKSFAFYANHLDIMDRMYDEVLVNLSKRQAEEGNK